MALSPTQILLVSALLKHMLVSGIPGYGKSNFLRTVVLSILQMGIPCTVIECAKREWRELKLNAHRMPPTLQEAVQKVRFYQASECAVSPLRIAPFEVVPGIGRDIRFGNLNRCLEGALPMEAPLPQILQTALEAMVYGKREETALSFSVLLKEALRVVDERGYSGETVSNIRGALHARLDSLACGTAGRVFSCAQSIPSPQHLLSTSKFIELDALTKHELSLACLFSLTRLWEMAQVQPWEGGLPRHVLVLEEAHVLLGLDTKAEQSASFADPQAYVTEMVLRMLQEFRALGIAVIICDQTPAALPPLVLKNVGTKVSFRVGDGEDRDVMANAMLLDEVRAEELGRLNVGEAYVWTEGYYRAKKIRTPLWAELMEAR